MKTIVLHGALGARFGRRFRLNVASPAEAIRALIVQLRGFRQALEAGEWRIVRSSGRVRSHWDLDEGQLALRLGRAKIIHIVPALSGAKRSNGVTKIIIGIVVVVASIFTYGAAAGWFAGAGATTGATAGGVAAAGGAGWVGNVAWSVGMMGVSMILSGISMLLAPQPRQMGETAQNPSYLFAGPANVGGQGMCVPLVYGRARVGSVVAAASLKVEQTEASARAVAAYNSLSGRIFGIVNGGA